VGWKSDENDGMLVLVLGVVGAKTVIAVFEMKGKGTGSKRSPLDDLASCVIANGGVQSGSVPEVRIDVEDMYPCGGNEIVPPMALPRSL
jgi:hypothetical protein